MGWLSKDWLYFISSTSVKQSNGGNKEQPYRKMKNGTIY